MKKALAILMVLALVTTVAFAQDAPATFGDNSTVAVSGFGQLTWGVNLNKKDNGGTGHGFENKAEWKIAIPLLGKQTFTKTGEGSYAEISIVDAQYNIEGKHDATGFTAGDKKIDKVAAKLVFGNIYMTVYGAPSWKSNQAEIWAPIKADGYFDDGKEGKALRFEPGFDAAGTKIGYKTDMFDVGFKVGSADDWVRSSASSDAKWEYILLKEELEITADNVASYPFYNIGDVIPATFPVVKYTPAAAFSAGESKSYYAFGIDATVTPSDMITASFTFNNAMWDGTATDDQDDVQPSFFSLGGKVVAKPIADLTATAGFDAGNNYSYDGDFIVAYDAKLDVGYKFATLGAYYASIGTPLQGYNGDGDRIGDLAVYAKLTDGGFVPNLTASVTIIAFHLLSDKAYYQDLYDAGAPTGIDKPTAPLALGVNVAYKYALNDVNYLKPFVNYYAQNMSALAKTGSGMVSAVEVGAEYGLFTNATITAKYAAGSTQDNKAFALIKTTSSGAADKDANDAGVFSIAAKVTY